MDTYTRQALTLLGQSIKSSGEIIETVSGWKGNAAIDHARRCHIDGATANVQRVAPIAAALGLLVA